MRWHSWYACAACSINLRMLFLLIKHPRLVLSNAAFSRTSNPPAWDADADASIVTAIW